MADNVVSNPGVGGATFATDDDGTAHHPYVKVEFGANNTQTPVSAANPLPVVQTGTHTVTGAGGTFPVTDSGGSLTVDGTVSVSGSVTVDSELTTADLDTGAGTDTRAVVGLVLAASGGALLVGSANPMPVSDNAGSLTVDGTITTSNTAGDTAHDAADAGNPVKVGATAETSPKGITLVADGDRTTLYADSDGMLMVKLNTSGADLISEAVSNTDGSSTAFSNFSAVASTKNAVTAISVFRSDAGASLAYVDFRDGTAGSVLWRMPLPPTGGSVITSPVPLFKTSANTALAFDVSSALSTVYISVSGFQTKV